MSSFVRSQAGVGRVASHETGERIRRAGLMIVAVVLLVMAGGGQWDVNWHLYVGRDWFWIPPHVLIYSSVAVSGLVALAVTVWDSLSGGPAAGRLGWLGVRAPAGFALVGLGALTMIVSAPFDDRWHRLHGIDLTIWSPPHLGGVIGGWIILLGVLVESVVGPAGVASGAGRGEWAAFLIACAGLLRTALFGNIPASQYTFWGDDFSFQFFGWRNPYLYPVLMSLSGAWVAVVAARASRRAWMPLAVVALALLVNRLAQWLADFGTVTLVRLTGQRRRFGRYDLGFSAEQMFLWPLLAMLAPMAVAAVALHVTRGWPGRRPAALTGLAFGLTLFLEFAVYLFTSWPALGLPLASIPLTMLSLGLMLAFGALSALAGWMLAEALTQFKPARAVGDRG